MADALPCLGPLRDILHLKDTAAAAAAAPLSGTEPPSPATHGGPVLLALTGTDRSGSVAVVRRGLVPEVIHT